MPRLNVRLFGAFEFRVDDVTVAGPSTAKARALVAFLLGHHGRAVARERLAEIFWPDSDGDRGRSSVGTALWSIRRALRSAGLEPDGYLVADQLTVRWHGAVDCDVTLFERAVESDPARAIDVYRGPLLDGTYDEWTAGERERLEALYETALSRSLGANAVDREGTATVVRNARLILDRNPYNEDAWTALIEHDLRAGSVSGARAKSARVAAAFAEAGLTLSDAFRDRYQTLLENTPPPSAVPFIGRGAESERILRALHDPGAAGGVAVMGQAGIGKTGLLHHVADALERAGTRTVWIVPQHRHFSLDALEQLAARVSGRSVDDLRADGSDTPPRVIAKALASDAAVTYVIDDLHWADGDAREILLALAQLPGRAIVAMRPEGRALLHQHTQSMFADLVELVELDRDSIVEALRATTLSESEREQIAAVSGGYPLALDALLRSPDARKAFRHVPDIARLLVERRLDERGDWPSRAASVIALEPLLDSEQAAAVMNAPVETVLDAFDDLYALGILIDGDDGPAFCHDVFAEVAARRIPPLRRRALHARIAKTIDAEANPARFAHHAARAGRALDAAQAFLRAAEARFTRGAFHDARELLSSGLAALGDLEGDAAADTRISLRIELARALADAGHQQDAVDVVTLAAAEARAARRDELVLRALLVRNRLGLEMASVRGAESNVADLREAVELAERLPAAMTTVQALGLAARGLMNRSIDAADQYAASALTIARQLDDPNALCEALQASATIAILRWNIERAIRETGEYVQIAQRIGTVRASRANGLHGVTHLLAHRYHDAEAFGRKALELAGAVLPDDDLLRVSRSRLEMLALELLTYVDQQQGRTAQAAAWAERRYALGAESIGDRCEAAAILCVVLLSQPSPPERVARAAAVLVPFADGEASIQRLYMLKIARAMLAAVRGDADAAGRVDDAWAACRDVPVEESITLDYWLAPLGAIARLTGCRDVESEASRRVREIVARRRAGSGSFWEPALGVEVPA
jgi:DNA-binding SARP family transcriptional activator